MSTSQIPGERVRILADQFLAIPTTSYQQRSLGAALALFLDTATKTALHRAELVSKSALSRLLNEYSWDTAQGWAVLQAAQWETLLLAARRKHRPLLRLSVDLTSIEKKGSVLPFVRVYNDVHGIHLVVLFAEYGRVKFPVGYRVYKGKGTSTPVTLARELLRTVPDSIKRRFRVRVLADSGFEAAAFFDEIRQLGFEFVVGVRSNRRTMHPGAVTVADCPHGGYVELMNWPHDTLVLGRVDRGDRVFHAVSSELMEGDNAVERRRIRLRGMTTNFRSLLRRFGRGHSQSASRTVRGMDIERTWHDSPLDISTVRRPPRSEVVHQFTALGEGCCSQAPGDVPPAASAGPIQWRSIRHPGDNSVSSRANSSPACSSSARVMGDSASNRKYAPVVSSVSRVRVPCRQFHARHVTPASSAHTTSPGSG